MNIIKQYKKMINYDVNIKEHNAKWPQTFDHSYKILTIISSRSWKIYALLNLIKQRNNDDFTIIDKIYLSVKDPHKAIYQYRNKETWKNLGLRSVKTQRHLLNIQIICRLSIKRRVDEYNLDRKF